MLSILIPVTDWILLCTMGLRVLKFFMPSVIGWIITMIANPLVCFLEHRVKLVRRHSPIVIVVTVLTLVVGLIYLTLSRSLVSLHGFMKDFPAFCKGTKGDVARSMEQIKHLFWSLPDNIQQAWVEIGGNLESYVGETVGKSASPTVEAAGLAVRSILVILVYPMVIILSAYFLIMDRDKILVMIKTHTPAWARCYTGYLRGEPPRLTGGYSMIQLKATAVVWLILTVGFLVLGAGYALL